MSKPTEVILLCEDYRQSSLMLNYLKRCGVSNGIRPILSPKGKGSAEHWVVQQYPIQVNAYRLAKARKHTWLIIMVDADTGTVAHRLAQLDTSLQHAEDLRVRKLVVTDEAIGRLIPRRNIETWLLLLTGADANETKDYKASKADEEWRATIPLASATFYAWTRANAQLPPNLAESLRHAIHELVHLTRNAR